MLVREVLVPHGIQGLRLDRRRGPAKLLAHKLNGAEGVRLPVGVRGRQALGVAYEDRHPRRRLGETGDLDAQPQRGTVSSASAESSRPIGDRYAPLALLI